MERGSRRAWDTSVQLPNRPPVILLLGPTTPAQDKPLTPDTHNHLFFPVHNPQDATTKRHPQKKPNTTRTTRKSKKGTHPPLSNLSPPLLFFLPILPLATNPPHCPLPPPSLTPPPTPPPLGAVLRSTAWRSARHLVWTPTVTTSSEQRALEAPALSHSMLRIFEAAAGQRRERARGRLYTEWGQRFFSRRPEAGESDAACNSGGRSRCHADEAADDEKWDSPIREAMKWLRLWCAEDPDTTIVVRR